MILADLNNAPIDNQNFGKLVGHNLKKLRESVGLTQEQLGKKIGVSQKAIAANEQGTAFPKIPTLKFLADFYGVSTDEILGRKLTLKRQLLHDNQLEQAIKRLSKFGRVDKTENGGYIFTISELASSEGKIEEIISAVTFLTADLLIRFVNNVMDTALSSDKTFEEILKFRVEKICK
ncbi:MAG: helix-turn-helix transcriptional regulator [Selenomonadaceae bacterium]|nr:helix-turn-helix transcriptional regulator [Selenomonadaceae bacterium]